MTNVDRTWPSQSSTLNRASSNHINETIGIRKDELIHCGVWQETNRKTFLPCSHNRLSISGNFLSSLLIYFRELRIVSICKSFNTRVVFVVSRFLPHLKGNCAISMSNQLNLISFLAQKKKLLKLLRFKISQKKKFDLETWKLSKFYFSAWKKIFFKRKLLKSVKYWKFVVFFEKFHFLTSLTNFLHLHFSF